MSVQVSQDWCDMTVTRFSEKQEGYSEQAEGSIFKVFNCSHRGVNQLLLRQLFWVFWVEEI